MQIYVCCLATRDVSYIVGRLATADTADMLMRRAHIYIYKAPYLDMVYI